MSDDMTELTLRAEVSRWRALYSVQHDRADRAQAEVERLRAVLANVEALWCPLSGGPAGAERECSWCEQFRAALASVPEPSEPECACPYTPPETWLSAASCGYGGGYEPGSMQEFNPDCPVHGHTREDQP